ncbi:methylenetetrahydrofolate reductase [NAD(P)H] [soil metagenome]
MFGHYACGMSRSVRDAFEAGTPTFSFEFFPPKTPEDERLLWTTIRELESLRPDFVSVTYGAGGATRDHTIEITEHIASDTTLLPVAHLTAIGHSVSELRAIIGRLADAGISNVLALRGDPPGDPLGEWVAHPEGLNYASDLVQLLTSHGDFTVGVAAFAYPHPRSSSVEEDTRRFVEKCQAGADYAITQMFFDPEAYLRLRDRVAAAGGTVPILAGLMPVTNMGIIARSEQFTGAPFPAELGARFAAIADDKKAVRELGIIETSRLAQRLLDEGAPGIHFYTLNRSKATREVWGNLTGASVVR